jgi:epoxyqueuosine reductase
MLIDRETGSYFYIAAALVKETLADSADQSPANLSRENPGYDFTEFCKDCHLCIKACPTGALLGDGLMETQKCISYRTIESKQGTEDVSVAGKKHNWVFGCDICQQVCPYNKQPSHFADEAFNREHPAAVLVASGEKISTRAYLKGSVFFRRGVERLNAQRTIAEKLLSTRHSRESGNR